MTATPRVLLPRPAGRTDDLVERLRDAGFAPEHHPFLELLPEADTDLREAVQDLADGAFAWLVLTSPAAVTALSAFDGSEDRRGVLFAVPEGTRIAVVGEGTAAALREAGVSPDLVAHGSGAALVEELPAPAVPGEAVLFPASSAAADTVPAGLTGAGYRVRQEVAYRPVSVALDPQVPRDLMHGNYAAIVLTSGMIARLAASLPIHLSTAVVTIGEPTTRAAQEAGLRVDAQAAEPTAAGLTVAVREAIDRLATGATGTAGPTEPTEPTSL